MNWYLQVLRNYAKFDGRARRKEYWFFALINFLIAVVLSVLGSAIVLFTNRGGDPEYTTLGGMVPVVLYSLAVFIPGLAVSVRRLHDSGKSGWLVLLGLIPFVGGLILFVLMLLESQPGANPYGPNPKGIEAGLQWDPAMPPRI